MSISLAAYNPEKAEIKKQINTKGICILERIHRKPHTAKTIQIDISKDTNI